jgi:hypothetical protein
MTKKKPKIVRTFAGLPVYEAGHDQTIVLRPEDIKCAVQGDPRHCAFANAAKRMFSADTVIFDRTVAYIELPDEGNKKALIRFTLPHKTVACLKHFDETGQAPEGGFKLRAPTPARTLDERRKRYSSKPKKNSSPPPKKIAARGSACYSRRGKAGMGAMAWQKVV